MSFNTNRAKGDGHGPQQTHATSRSQSDQLWIKVADAFWNESMIARGSTLLKVNTIVTYS